MPSFLEKVIQEKAKEYNLPNYVIEEIFNSQFKFLRKMMKDAKEKDDPKTLLLHKIGKFYPYLARIKKYKEGKQKYYDSLKKEGTIEANSTDSSKSKPERIINQKDWEIILDDKSISVSYALEISNRVTIERTEEISEIERIRRGIKDESDTRRITMLDAAAETWESKKEFLTSMCKSEEIVYNEDFSETRRVYSLELFSSNSSMVIDTTLEDRDKIHKAIKEWW